MSIKKQVLLIDSQRVEVTSDQIRQVDQLFRRAYPSGSGGEKLLLEIAQELTLSTGRKYGDDHDIAIIIGIFKILTTNHTVGEAREYLRTDAGKKKLHEMAFHRTTIATSKIEKPASSQEDRAAVALGSNRFVTIATPRQVLAVAIRLLWSISLWVFATIQLLLSKVVLQGSVVPRRLVPVSYVFGAEECSTYPSHQVKGSLLLLLHEYNLKTLQNAYLCVLAKFQDREDFADIVKDFKDEVIRLKLWGKEVDENAMLVVERSNELRSAVVVLLQEIASTLLTRARIYSQSNGYSNEYRILEELHEKVGKITIEETYQAQHFEPVDENTSADLEFCGLQELILDLRCYTSNLMDLVPVIEHTKVVLGSHQNVSKAQQSGTSKPQTSSTQNNSIEVETLEKIGTPMAASSQPVDFAISNTPFKRRDWNVDDTLCELCCLPFSQCVHSTSQSVHGAGRTPYRDQSIVLGVRTILWSELSVSSDSDQTQSGPALFSEELGPRSGQPASVQVDTEDIYTLNDQSSAQGDRNPVHAPRSRGAFQYEEIDSIETSDNEEELNRHRPTPSKSPFVCPVCDKGFLDERDLIMHEEKHNGVLLALPEAFRESVTESTYTNWNHSLEFVKWLLTSDLMKPKEKRTKEGVQVNWGDQFSVDGIHILYTFLTKTNNNHPTLVRNVLKDLGFPEDPVPGFDKELARFRFRFKPPQHQLGPFCIISRLMPKPEASLDIKAHSPTEKLCIMIDAFILLQKFSGSADAAETYLLTTVDPHLTMDVKESINLVLHDRRRHFLYNSFDHYFEPEFEEALQAGWDWFIQQATEDKLCGFLFRLAAVGVAVQEGRPLERLKELRIQPLEVLDSIWT